MFFNKFNREPLLWLLLAITVFLQFYRLGLGELQAWDESLYVLRAKACLEFGVWLDQTQYAAGGLYSSTHPPLGIWVMAGLVAILGESPTVWRLFSAIGACFGLFFLFKIARYYASERASLLAAILLGNAQYYLWFGHHAQLDIPLHAAVLATVWLTVKAIHSGRKLHYLFAGSALTISLLVKAFQGLYVLPFLLLLFIDSTVSRKYVKYFVVVSIALLVASSWYLYMMSEHGNYLSEYFTLVDRLGSGTYDKASRGNWWYYLNQFIISMPFFLPLLGAAIVSKAIDKPTRSAVVWTGIMFMGLSLMGTKMGHFVLFIVIPAAVALPRLIEKFESTEHKPRMNFFVYAALIVCTLWSLGMEIRNPSLFAHGVFNVNILLLTLVMLPFLGAWYFLSRKKTALEKILLLLAAVIVGGNLYRWTNRTDGAYDRGAGKTAALLDSMHVSNLLVLHSGNEYDSMQPQLAYYTYGWTLGWRSDKRYRTGSWFNVDSVTRSSTFDAAVVHLPWDAFSKPSASDSLALVNVDVQLRSRFSGYRKFGQYAVYY